MKQNTNTAILTLMFFFFYMCNLSAQSQYEGQHTDKIQVKSSIISKAYVFDLQNVKLLDSPFKENQERDMKWLLSLDNNRLLLAFRVYAGMAKHGTKPLGGWEALDSELRGHTLGNVLSALALMYTSTGNETFKQKGDSLVAELSKVQTVLNQDGYLGAFPQYLIDRDIAGEGRSAPGEAPWAPWYTVHKMLAGMLDMYLYTGNQTALEIAKKMGTWAYKKLSVLTQAQLDVMLDDEVGGISESCYNLYAITGNNEYQNLAQKFYQRKILEPLAKKEDKLKGWHANTFIPKIISEARGYELTGGEKMKQTAAFFWDAVVNHHTYATGGNSDYESFSSRDSLSNHMSSRTTETCNTYNMLKLTNHLFTWSADAKYADYYERALYNHILGSQDPETGMVCYYMPFKPGSFKVYSTPEKSFWCCVATGFENHAKYNEAIYFHKGNELYVNLFIPSELNWKEKGVKIKQETAYPEEDKTRLTLLSANGENLVIKLRYPSWATNGAVVKVNGKKQKVNETPGSYIALEKKWKSGDVVEVTYPMTFRLVVTPDNPNKVAIAYGPVILAGEMGNEGVTAPAPYAEGPWDFDKYTVPESLNHTIFSGVKPISEWGIKPIEGRQPLTFELTNGKGADKIKLVPYYRLHHQRYVIYWDLKQ
jgi:DUF1680 family protein